MSNALTVQEAAAELHHLINSRVASPRLEEIEAIVAKVSQPHEPSPMQPPLHAEIASVAAEYREAFSIDDDQRAEPLRRQLATLAAQLPRVPTAADAAAWAELAFAYAFEERNDAGEPVFSEECEEQNNAIANLIAAVRVLGDQGATRIHEAIAPGSQTRPSLSHAHIEFRRLVAELNKLVADDEEEDEASEAAMDRLSDQISAIESKVWSAPARALADVLLRGEIALYNENGVMDFIDDADAYEDDRAIAQLIRAVVDVLGKI